MNNKDQKIDNINNDENKFEEEIDNEIIENLAEENEIESITGQSNIPVPKNQNEDEANGKNDNLNNKNNNSKIIAISIVVSVLVIVIAVLLIYFSERNSKNNTVPTTTEVTTVDTTNKVTEENTETKEPTLQPTTEAPVTTEQNENTTNNNAFFNKVLGQWKPVKAINKNTNEEEKLDVVYGTSYSQYGGSLKFNNDSTFSIWIGAGRDDGSHNGTYTVSEYGIDVKYANNTSDKYKYEIKDGEISQIIAPQGDYDIYFIKD